MNCKSGDLAVIIRSDFSQNIGHLINVVKPADMHDYHRAPYGDDRFHWECEVIGGGLVGWDDAFKVTPCAKGILIAMADSDLMPIRDPGDDAVDEMVELCGSATARTA